MSKLLKGHNGRKGEKHWVRTMQDAREKPLWLLPQFQKAMEVRQHPPEPPHQGLEKERGCERHCMKPGK